MGRTIELRAQRRSTRRTERWARALRSVPVLVLLLVCSSAAAAQDRPSYASSLVAAQEGLVGRLEALARWCEGEKLYAAADETHRQILELEPDHTESRKALRFKLRKGVWVQSATYRKPKNQRKASLEELEVRQQKVLGSYKSRLFELNAEYADEASLQARERTLQQLLRMLPEDAEVRSALGETWLDDRWVLRETQVALRRRQLIPDLAKSCLQTAPEGRSTEATPLERKLELSWTAIRKTPYLRVAGTGTEEEVVNVLRTTLGAGEFFRSLLGVETLPPVGFAIYLLTNSGEKRQFLDRHPRVRPGDREFLNSLASAGIPGTSQTAQWSETKVKRLDRSVRETIGGMMTEAFGLKVDQGWAWEGVGIYLTYQLVGTRLTYYTRQDRYVEDTETAEVQKQLYRRMYSDESNWMDEARIYFSRHRPPKLNFLMGRKVNAMNMQDRLWSYVFAAYLIEGWPGQTSQYFELIGSGVHPAEACRTVFGMELGRLEQRLIRWLDEAQ